MPRPGGARDRTHRCHRNRVVAAAVVLAAANGFPSSVSISAFVAPWHLVSVQQQQQHHRHRRTSCRGSPTRFSCRRSSSSSSPVGSAWTSDRGVLFLAPQRSSTSAYAEAESTSSNVNNTAGIMSAVLPGGRSPLPQQQQQQQQFLLSLPQSPKKRQKAFSTTLVGFVKAGDVESALLMYGKAAEVGCNITENVFNAVLSVCDGDKVSQGISVFSDMIAAGVRPRENHYAFLLREATGRGAFHEAFSKVREMVEGGIQPRLRTYSSLLKGLCNKPDMSLAFEVWSHMTAQGVPPAPEQYVDMLKGWAAAGELRQRVIDGTVEKFLRQLAGMAFELSPTAEAAAAAAACGELPSAGEKGGIGNLADRSTTTTITTTTTSEADRSHLQALLTAFNSDSMFSFTRGDVQTYSASPVQVATVSSAMTLEGDGGGVCDCCGAPLQAVGLDQPARARVRLALTKLASSEAAQYPLPPLPVTSPPSGTRQSSRLDGAYAPAGGREEGEAERGGKGRGGGVSGLEHFAAWLEARRREGLHYTTVVDGCNVAYYGQNKEGGKFQISQVDLMARQLEEEGERVLVVLPERYLRPCVPNSARSRRRKNPPSALSDEDLEAIDVWRDRQMLYSCANGTDDDLFWMYFTVSSDDLPAEEIETEGVHPNGERNHAVVEMNGSARNGINGDRKWAEPGCQTPREAVGGGVSVGEGRGGGVGEDGRIGTGFSSIGGGSGGGGAARLTVVSNDEMRNHRMALLEPVPFKRWRNSQVRGFHFPASLPDERDAHRSTAPFQNGGAGAGEKGGPRREDRHRTPPVLGSPPPPTVMPSPAFTRDMQTCKHTWHIPIRGAREEPGEAGETQWLCIDLAAFFEGEKGGSGDGQTEDLRPQEIRPRRKYRS